MSEPEITNAQKTKTKNPKRVEQGRQLAMKSREAKERKKLERETFFESVEENEDEDGNKILFGIGLIGAAFLIYKIFLELKKEDEAQPTEPTEDEVPEDAKRPPKEPKDAHAKLPPKETKKKQGYYTMTDDDD